MILYVVEICGGKTIIGNPSYEIKDRGLRKSRRSTYLHIGGCFLLLLYTLPSYLLQIELFTLLNQVLTCSLR